MVGIPNAYFIIDLECYTRTTPAKDRIFKVGALRTDTDQTLERAVNSSTLLSVLAEIDDLSRGAEVLMGHNLIGFDLPLLRELDPHLRLLDLPVIDTLLLSPLAFPQNPYHRLIKDYKLVRDTLNSPLSDCRATHILFNEQQDAFSSLANSDPDQLSIYHSLMLTGALTTGEARNEGHIAREGLEQPYKDRNQQPARRALQMASGAVADNAESPALAAVAIDGFFRQFTGAPAPALSDIATRLPALLKESDPALSREYKVCSTALKALCETGIRTEMALPLAYTLAWLRVSGGNSVMPPWVTHQFPQVHSLIESLRDTPCGKPPCSYCATTHDPRHELQQYFGFDDFRYESPGNSAQHDVVLASMRGKSVLTVLATGGGKSVCYQLPALNRFHRNASLSIVISPLQSLMKDQVDGLLALNIRSVAALNGLLTMPERADVLDRIQMGDVGILLVSPEQFRNRSFRRVIEQRQVGAWVFDEAHCLSKWGNDFRPDYLYAARYIKKYTGEKRLAPVCCFTATAKLDVLDDIRQHFAETLDISFEEFIGSPERSNLQFEVRPVGTGEKPHAINALLENYLIGSDGGAVVFVSSRSRAEEYAEFLQSRKWACAFYHAGLQPNEKKDIQEIFQRGELRVITATNAFGMGVDKQDVRLVVHADIPGSLENYLQEAGRAGRDQKDAWCVLLYDPSDIESQFNLSARSRLKQRDIQQILTKLRVEAKRRKEDVLVITAGEILLDEKTQTSFEADDADAQTKVVTAVAWLERNEFLQREENRTTLFPARLTLDLPSALKRLVQANLPEHRQHSYRSILQYLYDADSDQLINTDTLMRITDMSSDVVSSALRQMEQLGILRNDTRITVYLRHGVASTSSERLKQSLQLEQAMFDNLPEMAPEADSGAWVDINLPTLTNWLRDATDIESLLPMHVNRLLSSLSQDRDGENKHRSVLELKHLNRDYLKMRLRHNHTWRQLRSLGARRRAVAALLLPFLVSKIKRGVVGKDVMVDTTFGELNTLMERDTEVCTLVKPDQRERAIQHVLLYLHQQEVLTLNHGMSVMRSAMTINLNESMDGKRFVKNHYQRLDEHYRERRIQVHVMREYAERAMHDMADALKLVLHYFQETRTQFNRRYFRGKSEILQLATSEDSWNSIVGDLNEVQRALVTDDSDNNQLILAGPGSGKTRVIVHRVAYLLRVRRVPAEAIIVLTFNRHAAGEIRKRLQALVDRDAWGLTIMTYHALAMRLTGTSFVDRGEAVAERELDTILDRAAELLEGTMNIDGENDIRDRLLQGYRYVLVDEYQDIDTRQYRLIRGLTHHDGTLDKTMSILAVGDDDQNIYEWRGGSNQHIERYRNEYEAGIHYLLENYRSSAAIIDSANRLIADNPERLKADHAIRINQDRQAEPAGGQWQTLDILRRGRVMILQLPAEDCTRGNIQAQAVITELQRLRELEAAAVWDGCAILARHHRMLQPLQAWCEHHKVDYHLAAERDNALPLTRQREFCALVETLRANKNTADYTLRKAVGDAGITHEKWLAFFNEAAEQIDNEFGEHLPASSTLIDWLYDYASSMRTQPPGGLYLGTVHASKGLEFRHVMLLDGGWRHDAKSIEQERRLYYVGMTRAMQTLTLCRHGAERHFADCSNSTAWKQSVELDSDAILETRYQRASLRDVDIGFSGSHAPDHEIHKAIAALREGDALKLMPMGNRYLLSNTDGIVVGRMSSSFKPSIKNAALGVAGIIVRYRSDIKTNERQFAGRIRCQRWEVVVPAIVGRQ
ncbi:MAG: RecQ family ATP-dependent DNA helicase [Granulosicoccus sp.]